MPGTNLTRAEARTRSDLLRVDDYRVDLDFTNAADPANTATFESVTEIRFACTRPGASTFVDLVAPRVREISLNGRAVDPATAYVDGRVELTDLAADNVLRIAADCAYMNTGEGLHRTVDPVDQRVYLYTHFEVPEARRLYATFEQPDLKASFTFTVTAPAGWLVLSNSPAPEPEAAQTGTDSAGIDGGGARAGVATWRFAPTPRISTYLTAIIAGDYHYVTDTYAAADGRVVPFGIACRRSMAEHLDADEIFDITRQGFDYYIERFDQPYPFAKYDQVFVPEYNIGAMENVGCVTFAEAFIFRSRTTQAARQSRAEVILHELAHMWFGDLVTMRWWDDLWLKESFATYLSVRCLADATAYRDAWTGFASEDKAWALRQDELPSTHPIVADIRDLDDVALNFDGITYAKGAAVLKQLVAWVGADEFFAGARRYFVDHAWGNTTLADLLAALEQASGRELSSWSRDWLQTAGPNALRPSFTVDDGRFTSFAIEQDAPTVTGATGAGTLRSHRVAVGLYDHTPDGLTRVDRVEFDVVGARTEVPAMVGRPRPPLVLLNDDDLTYARIRLDDRSVATVRDGIGSLLDSLARAVCWAAAWDMVRSAEWRARDYVAMVLGGIDRETDIGVVELLHANLVTAVTSYVDPAVRAATSATVAAAARDRMMTSAPGGDVQLAWARLFCRVASTDDDLALAATLRAESDDLGRDGARNAASSVVDGLVVDTDLRWALVGTLTRAGRLDAAEIEAERMRDNTTAGNENAAGALAARPTAEAKAAAWASVIDRSDLPNRTQDRIIGGVRRNPAGVGMVQSSQVELLRPYVDRYFDVIRTVWSNRTTEIGRTIASGLYPRLFVSTDTLDRTDALLADDDLPTTLRRLLSEERAELARSLDAQRRDSASG
ncbi:MAG TPA: aminopeptidase N [Micromonosporaceae bacterium]|nr:aminopeptidase N [Micromonosporaceae bacterium]